MSKIHISPAMITILVDAASTSQELELLLSMVSKSIHPYQRGYILSRIESLKQEEK